MFAFGRVCFRCLVVIVLLRKGHAVVTILRPDGGFYELLGICGGAWWP